MKFASVTFSSLIALLPALAIAAPLDASHSDVEADTLSLIERRAGKAWIRIASNGKTLTIPPGKDVKKEGDDYVFRFDGGLDTVPPNRHYTSPELRFKVGDKDVSRD
jgi:hypothetical protein